MRPPVVQHSAKCSWPVHDWLCKCTAAVVHLKMASVAGTCRRVNLSTLYCLQAASRQFSVPRAEHTAEHDCCNLLKRSDRGVVGA
jgi:hypothetical protein